MENSNSSYWKIENDAPAAEERKAESNSEIDSIMSYYSVMKASIANIAMFRRKADFRKRFLTIYPKPVRIRSLATHPT